MDGCRHAGLEGPWAAWPKGSRLHRRGPVQKRSLCRCGPRVASACGHGAWGWAACQRPLPDRTGPGLAPSAPDFTPPTLVTQGSQEVGVRVSVDPGLTRAPEPQALPTAKVVVIKLPAGCL